MAIFPVPAHAAPSQSDVFKQIQDSVSNQDETDWSPVIWLAGGGGAILLVIWLVNRRGQTASAPAAFNHPGKLMREVLRDVPLTAAEVRQLKLLADAVHGETGESATPLTLLLCPSLLAKGLQTKPARLDRKTLGQVVRKLQVRDPESRPRGRGD